MTSIIDTCTFLILFAEAIQPAVLFQSALLLNSDSTRSVSFVPPPPPESDVPGYALTHRVRS